MKLDPLEVDGRIAVTAAHGTSIAAAWYGTSRVAMATWLRSRGHSRPPGPPTEADRRRRAPREFCSCPMCAGVRAGTASDEFVETLHVLLSPPTSARPTLGLGREVWMIFGACRKLPDFQRHAWFFGPEFEPKPARCRREQQAKSVCADCRVRPACAEYALTNREDFGIWGGLTEDERRRSVRTIAV